MGRFASYVNILAVRILLQGRSNAVKKTQTAASNGSQLLIGGLLGAYVGHRLFPAWLRPLSQVFQADDPWPPERR